MTSNRRNFSRIAFHTEARLYAAGQEFEVEILDLSLKGALVKAPAGTYLPVGCPCTIKIRLDEMGTLIRMECTAVHRESGHFGLACREIDLDSVTHLRRLVELNLGDEAILAREINMLSGFSG